MSVRRRPRLALLGSIWSRLTDEMLVSARRSFRTSPTGGALWHYSNLVKLSSLGYLEGCYKPCVD
jgi:hypothetical protein